MSVTATHRKRQISYGQDKNTKNIYLKNINGTFFLKNSQPLQGLQKMETEEKLFMASFYCGKPNKSRV